MFLSVTPVDCIEMFERMIRLSLPPGSTIILVFSSTASQQSLNSIGD